MVQGNNIEEASYQDEARIVYLYLLLKPMYYEHSAKKDRAHRMAGKAAR